MSRTSAPEHPGVHTSTVVANAHFQGAVAVGDLRFDAAGTGVSEGVTECLAAYELDLLARDGMKSARHAFQGCAESHRINECQPFAGCSKRLRQFASVTCPRAQVHHAITTLFEYLIGAFERALQQFADRFARGNAVGNRLKAQYQTLYALQKSVVEVARDSFALGEAFLQATTYFGADLRHAEIIEPPQQEETSESTQETKPGGLIEGRTDRKAERCPNRIPHPIVVRGRNVKGVFTWTEVCIEHLAAPAGVLPLVVRTLQPVAKAHAFGDAQAAG